MHNFTQEDLLQYLYKETSPEMTAAIGAAVISDYNLREQMGLLAASIKQLNAVPLLSPRKSSINNILEYAGKTVTELTEH
ncbi:MAG: hypothetical protein ABIY51_05585 [Ferruginibacter sp.]